MNSYNYYTTNAKKPPVADILEQYYSSRIIKVGKHLKTNCINHPDTHPSMIVDKQSQRVHCFVCGFDADSWQVLGMATGKTFAELRRERGFVPDHAAIRRRQQAIQAEQRLQHDITGCWARLAKLSQDTYRAEQRVASVPTNNNADMMADCLYLREVVGAILDKLDSGDTLKQWAALWEARYRGLWNG